MAGHFFLRNIGYLYDGGTHVYYSALASNDTYLWSLKDYNGYKRIKNKSTIVTNSEYALTVSTYIHNNEKDILGIAPNLSYNNIDINKYIPKRSDNRWLKDIANTSGSGYYN